MWYDFGYDDDIAKDYNGRLNRCERPKKNGHNIIRIKTSQSQHYVAGLIPWYTSGFL